MDLAENRFGKTWKHFGARVKTCVFVCYFLL